MNRKNFKLKISNFKLKERGQIAIILVLALLSTATILVTALGILTFNEIKKLNNVVKSAQSYYAAEAGVEDAITRVKNKMNYPNPGTYTLAVGNGSTEVTISGPLDNLTIVSRGDVLKRIRKVAVNLSATPSDTNISFNYGVQVGDGGLFMENSSQVTGSVYSNGNITNNNNPRVTGDAFAAGTSEIDGKSWPGQSFDVDGNARARIIREARVGGTARAYQFINCQVGGIAYYESSITNCPAGGGSAQAAYSNLPALSMPISDAQLDQWEQEIEAAGNQINGPCPYEPPNGSTLGPVKINCDLLIDDNQVITMTGGIWVVGNFKITNQSRIVLSGSFGSKGSMIIADNPANRLTSSKIEVQNDARIEGSGDPDSFVIVASRNNSAESGGNEIAIKISNFTNAPIYYASHGELLIENNTDLFEAVGWRTHIKNNATVTYQSGLANALFSIGPGAAFKINSWEEIT